MQTVLLTIAAVIAGVAFSCASESTTEPHPGYIYRFAGDGQRQRDGDGQPAREASFDGMGGIANHNETLYVTEREAIRTIHLPTNMVATLTEGNDTEPDVGDRLSRLALTFTHIGVNESGRIALTHQLPSGSPEPNVALLLVDENGFVEMVRPVYQVQDLTVDADGNVYWIGTFDNREMSGIWKWSRSASEPQLIYAEVDGDTRVNTLAVAGDRLLFSLIELTRGEPVGERGAVSSVPDNGRLLSMDIASGSVEHLAGPFEGNPIFEGTPDLSFSQSVSVFDPDDLVYSNADNSVYYLQSDRAGAYIARISLDDLSLEVVAGNGYRDSTGNGGPADEAHISDGAIAVDSSGRVYLAERSSLTIRIVYP